MSAAKYLFPVGLVLIALGAAGSTKRRRGGGITMEPIDITGDPGMPPDDTIDPWSVPEGDTVLPKDGPPLPPIVEGPGNDPEIVALHNEMDGYFASRGVLDRATARQVTLLPKAPANRRYSIPDRRYWENMAATLAVLKETGLGDLKLRGYRPPWYNEKVNGSANSTHQWFSAVDIRRGEGTSMREIHDAAKWLWDNKSRDLNMGIGVYQNNIHIDTRRPRRAKWGSKKDILS